MMRETGSSGLFLIGIRSPYSQERIGESRYFFGFRAACFLRVFDFPFDFPDVAVFFFDFAGFFDAFFLADFFGDFCGSSAKMSSQPPANFFEEPV
jgi:hypothetical protein